MAEDGGDTKSETPLASEVVNLRSPQPCVSSPISLTNKTTRVPLQRIRCGRLDIRNDERWLEYERSSTHLKFFHKNRKHLDHDYCTLFECQDISAADLRVTAKFGYLDAMTGTLTIECQRYIQLDSHLATVVSSSIASYILEVNFHVNYTGQMRDVLRSLRQAKKAEASLNNNAFYKDDSGRSVVNRKTKLREGLPDWTPYIPHRIYTPFVRKGIELAITIYTICSILWALWQLYRHVDFIRAYVQPLIDALKYHVELLDKWTQILNALFEEMTKQWLAYIKPGCVILSSFASPLVAVGEQMWLVVSGLWSVVAVVFQPLYVVFGPLFKVIYLLFVKTPWAVLQPAFSAGAKCWSLFYNTVVYGVILSQLSHAKQVLSWLVEILEKSMKLDPLKAQLILMRSNVINSGKALSLGLVYIFKSIERRVWLMVARPVDDKED